VHLREVHHEALRLDELLGGDAEIDAVEAQQ
jgi:hypothetical protein